MDAAHPLATPTTAAQRATSIDALRGLAILGILAVNIQFFAFGYQETAPDPGAVDNLVGQLVHILFEYKFITIFSLLFGAGIVLMDNAAKRREQRWTARFLIRNGLLLAMGFLHGYLLWYGDILFTYALVGFAVFWLRGLRAKHLALIGGGLFLLGWLFTSWLWALGGDGGLPGDELVAARGSFVDRAAYYFWVTLILQTFGVAFFGSWFNTGLALLGMALAKRGAFRGELPTRVYLLVMLAAFALALPAIAVASFFKEGYDLPGAIAWEYTNLLLGPVVGAGYACAVILLCTRTSLAWIARPFAAVGRTALTNYILQSVVCVFMFYGGLGGLALIGTMNNAAAMGICLAIFTAQLVISPLWLTIFRFGPLEWLWRSLTYLKPQPMLLPGRPYPPAPRAE